MPNDSPLAQPSNSQAIFAALRDALAALYAGPPRRLWHAHRRLCAGRAAAPHPLPACHAPVY